MTIEAVVNVHELHPAWFAQAMVNMPESQVIHVQGCPIHYLSWNLEQTDKPALMFVHGYRAHARWWDFIAPFFTDAFRVVALDFSGMGDSGHRSHYDDNIFVQDMLGVLADAGMQQVTLVGHSFGGGRVLHACVEAPQLIRRAIVVDSYIRAAHESRPNVNQPKAVADPYPTQSSALARFRLTPEQPPGPAFVSDYIARHSVRQVPGGWDWKFDRALPTMMLAKEDEFERLSRIRVPVDYVLGEDSAVVSLQQAERLVAQIPDCRGPIVIPQANHHVMLSQPLALISTLRTLLA